MCVCMYQRVVRCAFLVLQVVEPDDLLVAQVVVTLQHYQLEHHLTISFVGLLYNDIFTLYCLTFNILCIFRNALHSFADETYILGGLQ